MQLRRNLKIRALRTYLLMVWVSEGSVELSGVFAQFTDAIDMSHLYPVLSGLTLLSPRREQAQHNPLTLMVARVF